jgi:NADH dehydrogenase
MQMGKHFDKGDLATIGLRRAVARVAWPFHAQWSERIAWLTWLFVHLAFLSGADHQMSGLFTWIYSYLTKTTRSRIIIATKEHRKGST